MTSGSTTERKAAIETVIAEVQLTDQGVVPVFKIPTDTAMPPPETDGGHLRSTTGSHNGAVGGAGGTRTRDRGIMSPLL